MRSITGASLSRPGTLYESLAMLKVPTNILFLHMACRSAQEGNIVVLVSANTSVKCMLVFNKTASAKSSLDTRTQLRLESLAVP